MKQASKAQKFLITAPEEIAEASRFGLPLAHLSYRIDKGAQLFRTGAPQVPHGGLMLISVARRDIEGDAALFCRTVLRECQARNFSGVMFDAEGTPTPTIARIIAGLSLQLSRRALPFYLPLCYANYSKSALLVVSSAISGGSLRARLSALIASHGANRLVLCLERAAEDFHLPAPQGSGRPLTQDELSQRIKRLSPSIFYSNELCAHYFTYMSRESGAHFILFDDAASLRKKMQLAEDLGLSRTLLFYAQCKDLLPTLLSPV